MSPGAGERPSINVLAGTNGGGKSSVAGAALRAGGAEYYNPDEATQALLRADPELGLDEANGLAWAEGVALLRRAIEEDRDFSFETTLGGSTIATLLERASLAGHSVRMHFIALETDDLHVARVRTRVGRGGHDIPEDKVRARYIRSIENLVRLIPGLTELVVWDNSREGDPEEGVAPHPQRILHYLEGELVHACPPAEVPEWAKPVYMAVYDVATRDGESAVQSGSSSHAPPTEKS